MVLVMISAQAASFVLIVAVLLLRPPSILHLRGGNGNDDPFGAPQQIQAGCDSTNSVGDIQINLPSLPHPVINCDPKPKKMSYVAVVNLMKPFAELVSTTTIANQGVLVSGFNDLVTAATLGLSGACHLLQTCMSDHLVAFSTNTGSLKGWKVNGAQPMSSQLIIRVRAQSPKAILIVEMLCQTNIDLHKIDIALHWSQRRRKTRPPQLAASVMSRGIQ